MKPLEVILSDGKGFSVKSD